MLDKRNRHRSKRRQIYCPTHICHLDSVSPKYRLYVDQAAMFANRGASHKRTLLLYRTQITSHLDDEWIEQFWCPLCQRSEWYHVIQHDNRTYSIAKAPIELCPQVSDSTPSGNRSVSQFTINHRYLAVSQQDIYPSN